MSRRGTVRTVLLAAAAVAALLAVDPAATRVGLAVVSCLLLPGLGWARKMRFGDRGDTVALAVVLSMGTTVAVGTVMALAGTWSLGGGLIALALVAGAGFLPARALADRAAAAFRLRTAGVVDDGGAWAEWYAATQQQAQTRRQRAATAAEQAAEVWVDWYFDVESRAEAARRQEEIAARQASEEWVAWHRDGQRSGADRDPDT